MVEIDVEPNIREIAAGEASIAEEGLILKSHMCVSIQSAERSHATEGISICSQMRVADTMASGIEHLHGEGRWHWPPGGSVSGC